MPTKRYEALEPERKAHWLACAAEEFAAHGFEGASFNRIVERAGTSKGAIYYYFEDKADLYATVLRDAFARLLLACPIPPPAPDVPTFWRGAERSLRTFVDYYRADPHIAGLIRSLAHDGLQAAPLADLRASSVAWFAQILVQGQAVGAVRSDLPVPLMVAVGNGVIEGFDLWLASNLPHLSEPELTAIGDQVIDLLRRMAQPGPRPAPEDP